ncbi:MAG: sigma 54-interacting transcriptional regulator [Bacteroidia bacterium]|nr:sigma 54-interacting transcriptional regulator [Bacteroidia bacterium]MBT8270104.1 sigma 54-interacting transcriptional regulator [Bacteroidia bacterium]NNF83103.1 sigma 54-interacting transcriptional regulator [Flavobacteriaceae bacterium]NNK70946.1 sigma 54-interacting transcriptional regulator [Flavobacteriaceae bacterium]NNL81511.1 sigma 54-interacting transcriptional regulator [Flavobacteriaceae bacterium]
MRLTELKTLGELKKAGYQSKNIKDELRDNLIENIKNGISSFEGIHGYEDTVIPELERAILSRHNINLLGLRGQAKTRLARLMVNLLDEYIPVVEGSEINDDPFNPLSRYAREKLMAQGDNTPISWLHREERFAEKLATPDVTIADLIGDVDPIKAANLKLSYADDRVIHYGMIPRANRSIFVINELPDLQARIQVALFNILQEGDIQIRGFKLRLPLDIQFVFTANPEDYTNRGSIVTPLKDRIGSQILTHYPDDIETAKKITKQESELVGSQKQHVHVPELAKDLLEQISFEARKSEYVDAKSGVSARMSITAYENLLSTAEHRALKAGDDFTSVRLSDFIGVIPAITGKIELVYEGEQEGADFVANTLIENAIQTLFPSYFPKIEKLEKQDEDGPYDEIVSWFFEGSGFELHDDIADEDYRAELDSIPPLDKLIDEFQSETDKKDLYFLKEFVLWGLVQFKKLSKHRYSKGIQFKDLYGSYISGL